MERTFVLGDIHGAYKALLQCFNRSNFDYENDHLICLGDVADGWPETKQCIDELLKIKHLIYILGNHDLWTLEWMEHGSIADVWHDQGGKATIDSYSASVPESHVAFLKNALPFLIDQGQRLFVHAGIQPDYPIEEHNLDTFLWSRDLAHKAYRNFQEGIERSITSFKEVYIGHTPIPHAHPVKGSEVWLMDTGAGWSGVLSMMEIETKQVFTSEPVPNLYPNFEGRKRIFR